MNLSDTYLNHPRGTIPSHLWFVVSNPTGANRVAVVNISTDNGRLSGLATLVPGDHEWITKESYIRTDKAYLADIALLRQGFEKKVLTAKARASIATVTKLQIALAKSIHTVREVRLTLQEQGFIASEPERPSSR